jgi:hypothetical protein
MVVGLHHTLRYKKRRYPVGTYHGVGRDLIYAPTSTLIQSLVHRVAGRLHTVVLHAVTTPETPTFAGSGAVPLWPADLLPRHRQVSLR